MAAGQDNGVEAAVQADLAQVMVLLLLEPATVPQSQQTCAMRGQES